jgi:hypothetical protein
VRLHSLTITDTLRDDLLRAARLAGITVDTTRAEVARLWPAINKDLGPDDILVTGFALSGVLTPEIFERAFALYEADPGCVEGRKPPKSWGTAAKVILQYPEAIGSKCASLARRIKISVGNVRMNVFRVALHLVRNETPPLPVGLPLEVKNLHTLIGPGEPSDLAVRTANAILTATDGPHPGLAREVVRILLSEWIRVQQQTVPA